MLRSLSATAGALLLALFVTLPAVPSGSASSPGRCTPVSSKVPRLPSAQFEDGPTLTQADLVADFDAWISGMRALNPDVSIRADLSSLNREAGRIRGALTGPMRRREAWMQFARLNPYLRDGHNGIYMPEYRRALQEHVNASGHIVPIEVRFAPDNSLRVFTVPSGMDGVEPGDRVLSINGHSTDRMVASMLKVSPGDAPAQQRAWTARRFAALYWLIYGDTGQYDLVIRSAQSGCRVEVRLAGATTLPTSLQPTPRSQGLFDWRFLRGEIGYLRVDSFDAGQRDALANVSRTAFTQFNQRGIRALIVDVRENGGGDDPLWQQSLMEYITSKPYVQLSRYVVRITKDNAGPGDVIGDVQRSEYTKRFTPNSVNPVRFEGPVYILAGPFTYSATIQFLVAAQDFGIARIAGEETAALSCQTGQVHRIDLPRTGLAAFTPIIAYTRPSGRGCERGVIPDVPITINEVMPDETLNSLVETILKH